jgi:lysophospholipase L1-like esterase
MEPVTARTRRVVLLVLIVVLQFALFESGMRVWGSSEAAPSFQGLFMDDPVIGYRLKPGAKTRFKTVEFEADIAINGSGVRDTDEIGPKQPGERRIVILGDSLVLSVQVDFDRTFGELLERQLNADAPPGVRYRVINAGVQGYGPIEQLLFFRRVVRALEPDIVLSAIFVGNDAEEAVISEPRLHGARPAAERLGDSLSTRLRRIVRRSMVLQVIRLRIKAVTDRLVPSSIAPEPPLQSYAADPAPRIQQGLDITRQAVSAIASEASAAGARTGIVLMPARFQVDDRDYGRLKDIVAEAGGELQRDAASRRFEEALSSVPVPRVDVLTAMREAPAGPDLFYQETVHLTPRGHTVVAGALERFLRESGLLDDQAPRAQDR